MKKSFTDLCGGIKSFLIAAALVGTVSGEAFAVDPTPDVTPTPGEVTSLSEIYILWEQSPLAFGEGEVTLSVNGEASTVLDPAFSPGMDMGFIKTPGNVWIKFDPEITAPGTYTITVPAGYVYVNNAAAYNGEMILEYVIKDNGDNPGGGSGDEPGEIPVPVINPADGSTVESISQVTLDWGMEITEGSLGSGWFSSVNVFRDGEYYAYPEAEEIADNKVVLYFDPAIKEAGNYEIVIPEGFVFFPNLGDEVANDEIKIKYTIEGGNENPAVGVSPAGVNPADGSELQILSDIVIDWNMRYISLGSGNATITKTGGSTTDISGMISTANGSPFGGGATATVNFSEPFTEEGEYTVVIPAGFFNLSSSMMGGMEGSAEIVLVYKVTGGEVVIPAPEFTATPADGSKISELSEVKIQWGSSMISKKNGGDITVSVNGGEAKVVEDCSIYEGTEPMWGGLVPGNAGNLTIHFNPPYTEKGTYTVTIPAGYVTVRDVSAPNGEIVLVYEVSGEEFKEPAPVATPADNSVVESIETIIIDWGVEIEEGDSMGGWVSEVTILKDGEEYYDAIVDSEYVALDNTAIILIDPAITEPGKYEIVIPDDYVFFTNGDMGNTGFTLTYTVKEEGEDPDQPVDPTPDDDYTVIPSAKEPVEELPEIVTILFGDRREDLNIIAAEHATLQIGEEEPVDITEDVMVDYEEEGEGLDLKFLYFAAINLSDYVETAKGNCTITLPAGFFNIGGVTILGQLYGGEPSPEVVIVYVVEQPSGIKGISADADGLYRVYGINGVNVLTTADILDLDNLAKGIYIINGRKYIIR